jgi:hypothetical protein
MASRRTSIIRQSEKLSIYTQNIAGEFQPAKLDLKIYQLAAPHV